MVKITRPSRMEILHRGPFGTICLSGDNGKIWKREKKRAEKKHLTTEKGRMVKRLLFLTPAFAPLALVLRAFGAQPMRFWRSAFAPCSGNVHAGYPWDIPRFPMICSRYAQDMLKICSRYAQHMPNICPRYAQDLLKICPRNAQDMPKISPRYAQDML